mgnify:CR=1 FL=1
MKAISFASSGPTYVNSNTELVVTYNGQEEFRRNTRYISEKQLRSLLDQGKETIIIFGADWCKACGLVRETITKAKFNTKVHWLNLNEPWTSKLAVIMGIKSIPIMFHVSKDGNTLGVRVGPASIISYLAIRY